MCVRVCFKRKHPRKIVWRRRRINNIWRIKQSFGVFNTERKEFPWKQSLDPINEFSQSVCHHLELNNPTNQPAIVKLLLFIIIIVLLLGCSIWVCRSRRHRHRRRRRRLSYHFNCEDFSQRPSRFRLVSNVYGYCGKFCFPCYWLLVAAPLPHHISNSFISLFCEFQFLEKSKILKRK